MTGMTLSATPSRAIPRRFLAALLTLVVLAGSEAARAAEPATDLDQQLLAQSSGVLQALRDRGYKNVGVLKFRIKKGQAPVSDSVGTMNMFLADRLEVALVLANPNAADRQLGIIRNASAVAARIPGASHVSAAGRTKLFTGEYPLAWGDQKVAADAFLTGVVQIDETLDKGVMGLLVFDQKSEKLEQLVAPFEIRTNAQHMAELGESFATRGAFDHGTPQMTQTAIVEEAAKVKGDREAHPLLSPTAPAGLEIRYDDRPVPLDFRDGKAFVAEPEEGQVVTLVLKRKATDKLRYGIVLKVNGENTLYRERRRDSDCSRWILEPASPPIVVRGYQVDDATAQQFRVASQAESKANEMNYGADVGMIQMTVFRELPSDAPPPKPTLVPNDLPEEEAEDLVALSRGVFPAETPKNLAALKHQLREGGRGGETRGLILQGQNTESATRTVPFRADPTPVLSCSIVYYKK